jgi:hypothetical protein
MAVIASLCVALERSNRRPEISLTVLLAFTIVTNKMGPGTRWGIQRLYYNNISQNEYSKRR